MTFIYGAYIGFLLCILYAVVKALEADSDEGTLGWFTLAAFFVVLTSIFGNIL